MFGLPNFLFGKKTKPIRSKRFQNNFQPRLESLEDRVVMSVSPAIIIGKLPAGLVETVTSSGDLGTTSGTTLRMAINALNSDTTLRSSPDEIVFDNGGYVFLNSALPPLTRAGVVINGLNEANGLAEDLSGVAFLAPLSTAVTGLTINGGGTTVENLNVINCTNGIVLGAQGGDTLAYDSFGYSPAGVAGNQGYGAVISNVASNTINDCTFVANAVGGIEITGSGATGNTVSANDIGNVAGTTAEAGQRDGIDFIGTVSGTTFAGPANNNVIGNIISGNQANAVNVEGNGNVVQDNFIGTDSTGEKSLPNGGIGVDIGPALTVVVGSSIVNVPVATSTVVDDNVISNNGGIGLYLGGNGSVVQLNYIGTDLKGETAMPNGPLSVPQPNGSIAVSYDGIYVAGSSNLIGGAAVADRNQIFVYAANSADSSSDIFIDGTTYTATGNYVEGNFLGTDATGNVLLQLANAPSNPASNGVNIEGSNTSGNVIGGSVSGEGNLIAGAHVGILICDQAATTSQSSFAGQNTIQGNKINTNEAGTQTLFTGIGINLDDTANNLIGGTTLSSANVIGVGLNEFGIEVQNSGAISTSLSTTGNQIIGNYVGVSETGTSLGASGATGIVLSGTSGNTANSNIIGFCGASGIALTGSLAAGNTADGNTIEDCPIGIAGITGSTVLNDTFVNDQINTTP